MISLISSQQARDRFLELTGPDVTAPGDSDGSSSVDSDVGNIYNSCIINTNVLVSDAQERECAYYISSLCIHSLVAFVFSRDNLTWVSSKS